MSAEYKKFLEAREALAIAEEAYKAAMQVVFKPMGNKNTAAFYNLNRANVYYPFAVESLPLEAYLEMKSTYLQRIK